MIKIIEESIKGFNLRIENLEYTINRLERGYLNL
jgi:exonuclease VII small subunit